MDGHLILGITGAMLVVISVLPYFRDTLHGHTRPNSVSWFGWTLLCFSSTLIQLTHHPDYSVIFLAVDTFCTFAVFLLSLRHGVRRYTLIDGYCLLLGITGFFVWLYLNEPVHALLMNIAADFAFTIPTIIKAYKRPDSESSLSWGLCFLGMFLGVLSKTNFDLINTLFPVYLVLSNGIVLGLSLRSLSRLPARKRVRYHHR
jgi:hypothetical protein